MAPRIIGLQDMLAAPARGHVIVAGAVGSGKSVLLAQAGTWAAQEGHRVISLDAYGNSVRLAKRHGGRAFDASTHRCLNLLDIAYDDVAEASWFERQIQHDVGVASAVLSDHGLNEAGYAEVRPHRLSPGARGALEAALTQLYRSCTLSTPLHEMPTLSDLIGALHQGGNEDSVGVALALRAVLFVADESSELRHTAVGARFDGLTTEPWNFTSPLTAIDMGLALEPWRRMINAHALGALLHFLSGLPRVLRGREQQRMTYLLLDPIDELVSTTVGGQLLAELARRAKPLRLRIVAVAQSPESVLENPYGQLVWENAAKVLFRLGDIEARWVANALPALRPEHLHVLQRAEPGNGVVVADAGVEPFAVELSPIERALEQRS